MTDKQNNLDQNILGDYPPPIDGYFDWKKQYLESVRSTPDPHKQVLADIAKKLETISLDKDNPEECSEIINWLFYPTIGMDASSFLLIGSESAMVGVLGWDSAIYGWFYLPIQELERILIEDIEKCPTRAYDFNSLTSHTDEKQLQILSEVNKLVRKRISDLGLQEMPDFIKSRLTTDQKKVLGLLKKISKSTTGSKYHKTSNSPDMLAVKEIVNINKTLLNHPGEPSIFPSDPEVDYWDGSKSGSKDARKITVKKNSINNSVMTLIFAVENSKVLLKNKIQALKFLNFIAEHLSNHTVELDVSEFAELTGSEYKNARRTLQDGAKLLRELHLGGANGYIDIFPTILVGEGKTPNGKTVGKRGKVFVRLNPDIDLVMGGNRFMYIPRWIYKLSQNPYILADYIYSRFRMDAKNINPEKGYHEKIFDLETILPVLNLPHPNETIRPKQFIIQPLQEAIDKFNQAELENGGGMELSLEVDCYKSFSGVVKAKLKKCEYFDLLVEVAKKQKEYIEQANKKAEDKQRRIDQAKGRQLARIESKKKENPEP